MLQGWTCFAEEVGLLAMSVRVGLSPAGPPLEPRAAKLKIILCAAGHAVSRCMVSVTRRTRVRRRIVYVWFSWQWLRLSVTELQQ
jgi:hypothetical protein